MITSDSSSHSLRILAFVAFWREWLMVASVTDSFDCGGFGFCGVKPPGIAGCGKLELASNMSS
jgi:hypothetical protein